MGGRSSTWQYIKDLHFTSVLLHWAWLIYLQKHERRSWPRDSINNKTNPFTRQKTVSLFLTSSPPPFFFLNKTSENKITINTDNTVKSTPPFQTITFAKPFWTPTSLYNDNTAWLVCVKSVVQTIKKTHKSKLHIKIWFQSRVKQSKGKILFFNVS